MKTWRYECLYCGKQSEVIESKIEPDDASLCCNETRMIVIETVKEKEEDE